ncbi:MAG TPA: GAF domain-containing protein [Chloroflexi bacterium]|nr:GAF domain-containing protein [Chloroflexota bacterium]
MDWYTTSPTRPAMEEQASSLLDITGADQIFVYTSSEESEALDPLLAFGTLSLSEKQAFWSTQVEPSTDVLVGELVTLRRPIEVNNPEARKHYTASLITQFQAQSWQAYPLMNHDNLLGMVLLSWMQDGHTLPQKETRLVTAVVRSMALALENSRLYASTSRQLQQTKVLQEITQAILQKLDLHEVLQIIAEQATRLTDALGCAIRLVDERGQLYVALESGRSLADRFAPLLPADLMQRREPVLFNLDPDDAVLAVPLVTGEEAAGVLEIYHRRAYFLPHHATIARGFAGQAAVAIEHAKLYRRVQQAAAADERARLARDLHDSLNQSLYALTLYTRAAQRQLAAGNLEAVNQHLEDLYQSARTGLGEIRLLIYELRPPILEAHGLQGALERRLRTVEERSGLKVTFEPSLPGPLDADLEENLYRLAEEALNNVIKHARASQVTLRLGEDGGVVRLEVIDDGRGFDPEKLAAGGQGLHNMRERAALLDGKLILESRPGGGTRIIVEVPNGENSRSAGG